jgi:hypothetical protein
LVPANGGVDATDALTYGPNDVTWGTPAFNNSAALGAGSAATNGQQATLLANNCIGYAFTDYVAACVADNNLNYEIQTAHKTIVTDKLVQYAIVDTTQDDVKQGTAVMASNANIGRWRPIASSDFTNAAATLITMSNIVGRVMTVEKVTDHLLKADAIQGAPGLGLYGTEATSGLPNFLSDAIDVTRPDNSAAGNATGKYCAKILIRI